jgi:hypothetical protein
MAAATTLVSAHEPVPRPKAVRSSVKAASMIRSLPSGWVLT